jgi:peptidoglycan glycosyltransferase
MTSFGLGIYAGGAGARSQRAFVERYTQAWSRGDYALMYSMLDGPSRQQWSLSAFRAAYRAAADTATERSVSIASVASPSGGGVAVDALVHTRLFGILRGTVEIPNGSDGPSVRFNPTMVFPGLQYGEVLHREVALGTRGNLLADDGVPLAEGTSLRSPIPTVGAQVVGSVGRIPSAEAEHYAALGYPPRSIVGLSGLEQLFQSRLAGRIGGTLFAGQRVLATVAPENGQNVRTTISPPVEEAVLTALGSSYSGMTVMDPRSGALLAVAGIALDDVQPPGSTMKIVTASAALEAGITTIGTVYQYATEADVYGFEIHNSDGEDCGGTLLDAFAVSCNSVFAPLGAQVGGQRLVTMAERFGFNHLPNIPGALESTIPSAATIGNPLAVASSAIGQGDVLASTLEMDDVGATIAMGGRRPIPTFLDHAKPHFVRVIPGRISRMVQSMMIAVVAWGTGTSAQISGVKVAGKTGTAELTNTSTQKNATQETDAWFVGYAPVGRPRVVACALFPNQGFGAGTAAPAVREAIEVALETKY